MTHEVRVNTYQLKNKRPVAGAYGWMVSPLKKDGTIDVYWINGGTAGYRAFIAFEKKTNTAVVLLSNSANNIDELGFHLMEALYVEKELIAEK